MAQILSTDWVARYQDAGAAVTGTSRGYRGGASCELTMAPVGWILSSEDN